MRKNKYLFIDFDNTIREEIPLDVDVFSWNSRPPFEKEEVKILKGIPEKLRYWEDRGYQIIGVSNQSGVEKGIVTEEKVEEIASYTMDLMGIYFPFYFAPHKDSGTFEQLNLRKPNIGMAEEAIKDWGEMDVENSFMVGDNDVDEEFANNLKIRFVNVDYFLTDFVF